MSVYSNTAAETTYREDQTVEYDSGKIEGFAPFSEEVVRRLEVIRGKDQPEQCDKAVRGGSGHSSRGDERGEGDLTRQNSAKK